MAAGVLNLVYSIATLVLVLAGVLFVFTRYEMSGESRWSLWGTAAALLLFVFAMVFTTVSAA